MTMRTCHACGAMLPDSANFCAVCGEALGSAANAEKKANAGKKLKAKKKADLSQAPVRGYSPQKADAISSLPTNQLVDRVGKAGLTGRSSDRRAQAADPSAEASPTKPVSDSSTIAHLGRGTPTEPVTHNPFAMPRAVLTPRPLTVPQQEEIQAPPFATPPPFQVPPASYTRKQQKRRARPGCVTWLTILVLVLILVTISAIALGQTILLPSIAIENNVQSASAGQIHLHGSNFIPNDTITLMLDNTQPLYSSSRANTVRARSDGTFDVTIPVETKWRLGLHTVQALEGLTQRRAVISFVLDQAGETPTITPTLTSTSTPALSATFNGELSGVLPSVVVLGPVSAGFGQNVSEQVTLTATGAGQVSWKASWDQASWLNLNQTSGVIQSPASQTITVSAQASSLGKGTYSATIRFSSSQSAQNITLLVIFIVTAANSP